MWDVAKRQALAAFCNVSTKEVEGQGQVFQVYDQAFLVLADDEADEVVTDTLDAASLATLESEGGRGSVIASDGEENEELGFYIYRRN
jgi:hypothetical protein